MIYMMRGGFRPSTTIILMYWYFSRICLYLFCVCVFVVWLVSVRSCCYFLGFIPLKFNYDHIISQISPNSSLPDYVITDILFGKSEHFKHIKKSQKYEHKVKYSNTIFWQIARSVSYFIDQCFRDYPEILP